MDIKLYARIHYKKNLWVKTSVADPVNFIFALHVPTCPLDVQI